MYEEGWQRTPRTRTRRGGRCPSCTEEAEQYAREEMYVSPPVYPEALYVVGQRVP